ncbi:tetratricopeptide repeat protein [Lysinibacter sp. HNR]|uniref:tetratricopeptide repeat protein n=1 Tax=Lysinibacter sp. HNR TaxID=3031408 RepID=UPI0024360F27|nr:tetratricopeptide repeat protein [Lysinibacter sp. HNR]WGD37874.1 tetratricopeptide repeat protein [Lysinibacter sp. HNR]
MKIRKVWGVVLPLVFILGLSACSTPAEPEAEPSASASAERDAVNELINIGIAEANANKISEAESTFKNVLALDPGNYFVLYDLGVLEQSKGNNNQALSYYDQALETNPDYTPALYNKAIIVEESNPQEAISMYEKIVGLDDQASTAYYHLSQLYAAEGNQNKAQEARDKALELQPSLASEG